MDQYVVEFYEINQKCQMAVGGKGVNLGELTNISSIQVPKGFCVTTKAFKESVESNENYQNLLGELTLLKAENRTEIREVARKIGKLIVKVEIPDGVLKGISDYLIKYGLGNAYAIRSGATAEDLPHASFAGQQDTYLNIKGKDAILEHIKKCWASLFTDRVVIYRMQNGFEHRKVYLSVVIQRMKKSRLCICWTSANDDGPYETIGIVIFHINNTCPYAYGRGKIIQRTGAIGSIKGIVQWGTKSGKNKTNDPLDTEFQRL